MRNQKTSRAERNNSPLEGSRKPGAPGGRSMSLPARAKTAPATPASNYRKGVLAEHVDEIRRLAEAGMRSSNVARRYGVTCAAITELLGGKSYRRKNRRFSQCGYCNGQIAVSGSATRNICERCSDRICPKIYDRDRDPIDTLPA